MAEQSSPEARKHSPLKTVAKKIAPVILAATVAFSSDSKAPLTTPITPPLISQEQGQVEAEKIPFKPQATIIDARPTEPTSGIIQKEFPSNDDFLRKLLGDKFISREELERKIYFENEMGDVAKEYPQAVMLYGFFDTYFSHGQQVVQTMERTFDKLGLKSTGIDLVPLQNVFDKEDVKFVTDSLGNSGVSIDFDHQKIIELLKNDSNHIVNMSFQVGNVEMFSIKKMQKITPMAPIVDLNAYEDANGNIYLGVDSDIHSKTGKYLDSSGKEIKPITKEKFDELRKDKQQEADQNAANSPAVEREYTVKKIVGAYDYDKAKENLPKLFAVANAYPDKLFFAAAGNEGEDFEDALKELKGQKPKNLLIVGQWTSSYGPTQKVFGADIYVDNGKLGDGSSISTPILAAYAETLFRQGLSQEKVLEKIKASSHQKDYDFNLSNVTKKGNTMVFDPPF